MSDYVAHELTRDGWKLKVAQDDDGSFGNPYHEYDQLTDCCSWMNNYDLNSLRRKVGKNWSGYAEYEGPQEVVEAYERGEVVYYAPLYAYIHSGITVKLGSMGNWPDQQWDCGLAGMVYVTKEKAAKEWPKLGGRTLWLACARTAKHEIKSLDDWLTGNIWGYQITNPDGEVVDSCWGFLGDSEYCFEEGNGSLDYYLATDAERLAEQSQGALAELMELPLLKEVEYYA